MKHRGGTSRPQLMSYYSKSWLTGEAMWKSSGKWVIDPAVADRQLDAFPSVKKATPAASYDPIKASQLVDQLRTTEQKEEASRLTVINNKNQLDHAKAAKEVFNAKLAQLDYEEKSGELVRVADIRKKLYEVARDVRNSMLSIAPRTAPLLVAMDDQHDIEHKLTEEIAMGLEILSNALLSE